MTGLFNSIGHETEEATSHAAAELHNAIAGIHQLLAAVELRDVQNGSQQDGLASVLDQVADQFDAVAEEAGTYPLFTPIDQRATLGIEMAPLVEALVAHGYTLPMTNDDLPRVASAEIHKLALVLRSARFQGRHADWYSIRDVLTQVNRVNDLGVIVSRVSALHGGDPQLRY